MIDKLSPTDLELVYREFRDHAAFCRTSLIVETEAKQLVPMVLGPGQIRLADAIKRQRAKGVPVRLIYLKSRRVQATTGTAAHFFHSTAFAAGVHTAVIAHDDVSTQNIFGIYKRFFNLYKPFAGVIRMGPSPGPRGDKIAFSYGDEPESSYIQVRTAGAMNFGRSFRLTNVHLSEFPYYERPAELLASVMSGVPKTPDTTAIIEGTAKTIGDVFHKLWQAAMDPATASEWVGLFLGWWEHPLNRMPVHDIERFGNSLTLEERQLMGLYNLTFEQLAWRRWTIVNDFAGDLVRFRREHPATPEDAFTASSRNRFSVPHIQRQPVQRDPLVGELVQDPVGIEKRLVFLPSEFGALRVWKKPERGRLYAAGADCAQGLDVAAGDGQSDPDYSATQILDRDTGEQVAVLHARMMPGETGRYNARLCAWYNMAQCCGERNPGGGGVSMLEAMLNADYPSSLLYHRPVTPDQDPQVRGDRIGWDTSGVSRPLLIGYLDEAIRQDAITLRDHMTVMELLTFVIWPDGKAKAQKGCHDDLVIALALALIVIQRMPRPTERETLRAPEVRRYGQGPAGDRPRGTNTRIR
jgi:hypothetical protein